MQSKLAYVTNIQICQYQKNNNLMKHSNNDLHHNINFVCRFAQSNFQRSQVSHEKLYTFGSLLNRLIPKIEKQIEEDDMKAIIQIIGSTLANFTEIGMCHQIEYDKWNEYLYNVIDFYFHAINAYLNKKSKRITEVLDIFWPFYTQTLAQNSIEQVEKKIAKMQFLADQSLNDFQKKYTEKRTDLSENQETIVLNFLLRQNKPSTRQTVKYLIQDVLSFYNDKNRNCIQSLLIMGELFIAENNLPAFKKFLDVYVALSSSPDEYCHNIQILVNRILKSNNVFVFMKNLSQEIGLEKIYTSEQIFRIGMMILKKIFETQFQRQGTTPDYCQAQLPQALKIIETYIFLINSVKSFDEKSIKNLPKLIIRFIIRLKRNLGGKNKNKQKKYPPFDFQTAQYKHIQGNEQVQTNLFDLKKSMAVEGEFTQTQIQSFNNLATTSTDILTRILKNLLKNKDMKKTLQFSAKQTFQILQDQDLLNHPALCNFVMEIFPFLTKEVNIKLGQKNALIMRVMIRVVQLQCINSSEKAFENFKICHQMLKRPEKMNYHFVVAYLFLKYIPSSLREKVINFFVSQILEDCKKAQENTKQIQLNLILLHDFVQLRVNSKIKILVKHFLKNYKALSNPLQLKQCVAIGARDCLQLVKETREQQKLDFIESVENSELSSKTHKQQVQPLCFEVPDGILRVMRQVNCQLQHFKKDNLNLLYTVIIEMNKICIAAREGFEPPRFIAYIVMMQETSLISSLSVILNNSRLILAKNIEKDNIIAAYHYLLKLDLCLKQKKQQKTELLQVQSAIDCIYGFVLKLNQKQQISLETLLQVYLDSRLTAPQVKLKRDTFQRKFLNYLIESQMVTFYSQADACLSRIYVALTVKSLQIIRSLQLLKDKIVKQAASQMNQAIEEQNNKVDKLRNLQLLYAGNEIMEKFKETSEKKFTLSQLQLCRTYLASVILKNYQKSTSDSKEEKELLKSLVQDIEKNPLSIVKLSVKQKCQDTIILPNLDSSNFIDFLTTEILQQSSQPKNKQQYLNYLSIMKTILDSSSEIKQATKQSFGTKIAKQLQYIVVSRTKSGLLLTKPQERAEFSQTSKKIYELFAELVHQQQQNTIQILKAFTKFDSMEAIQTSKFIINEIRSITPMIQKKTEEITDLIFEYAIGLKEAYPQKYNSLQLPNFIADFFEIAKTKFNLNDLKGLQKSQKAFAHSNQQPSYKCLKCGDKGLICLGCSVSCHKDHPIVYLQGILRGNQKICACRENKNNRCKHIGNVSKKQQKAPRRQDMQNFFSYGVGMFSRQALAPGLGAPLDRPPRILDVQSHRRMIEEGRLQILDGEEQRRMRIGYAPSKYGGRRYQRLDRDQQQMFFQRIGRPAEPKNYQKLLIQSNEEDKLQQIQALNSIVSLGEQDELFEPQQYSYKPSVKAMEVEEAQIQSIIESRAYYLPVFLQMTNQICEQRQVKNINQKSSNQVTWKMSLEQPTNGKCYGQTWKMTNNGSYPTKYRKDNPPQGKSAVVSRKTLVCRGKYFMIGCNMNVFIYPKEKILTYIMENKNCLISFPPTIQQNLGVDAHSFDFSPIDENVFCAAGLHILYFYTISPDRSISRNTAYFQVPGDYINKIKFTKLGVFFSMTRQIKLISTNGKQLLSIRAPGQPLIRQWCCYEKQMSCTIYIVTPDGNIYYGEIDTYDEGKKTFFSMVNDPRKKRQVGASIFVKDTSQAGKILLASFKDGSNIIGRLEDNQLQDCSFMNFKPLFDKNFIMGHIDFARTNSNKEFNIICTLKPSLNNQMTIHQGVLTVIKIHKHSNKVEVQQINNDHKCETFCVIPIGDKWALVSLHEDGSLQMTLSGKISKNMIQDQIKSIKQTQNVTENVNNEKVERIRLSVRQKVNVQMLKTTELNPQNNFREFSSLAKVNTQYSITKVNESQFEVKYLNFNRIITGFTIPVFGNVILPTRKVLNTLQIGFSSLQALFFFAQGSFTFTYQKNQGQKYFRDAVPTRINQRIPEGINPNQFNERIWMKKKFQAAISIQEKTEIIECYADSIELFKARLPKFDQVFNLKDQQNGPQRQLKKSIQILRIFLKNVVDTQNYELFTQGATQILQFVQKIRKVLIVANKNFYRKLKEVTILALQIHAHINGKDSDPVNDSYHGLRYATQGKLDHLYNLLKGDTTEEELKQVLFFIHEVLEDSQDLFIFYIAKYPSLLAKIHKKMKKIDQQGVIRSLFDIYIAGYGVLQDLSYNSSWIPISICTIFTTHKDKQTRQDLFDSLIKYSKITPKTWTKVVQAIDAEESKKQIDLPVENPVIQQNDVFDYQAQLRMLGNIQDEAQYQRMILRISEMEYEQQRLKQEKAMLVQQQGQKQLLQKQQERDMVPVQQEMQPEISSKVIKSLIQTGMRSLEIGEEAEIAISRVLMLYVVFKVAEITEHQIINLILTKLKKFLMNVTPIKDIKNQTTTMLYLSLFGECLGSSKHLKQNGLENNQMYKQIKAIVIDVLNTIPMDQVKKTKKIPNLLAKAIKGIKIQCDLHFAYGLVSILRPPCQPDPVLLTLKCYWLFPQKKQHYKRIKYENAMNQAMKTNNFKNLKDIAFRNPRIWRDIADLDWLQEQMLVSSAKKQDCQILMDLMDLFYEEECQKIIDKSKQEKKIQ